MRGSRAAKRSSRCSASAMRSSRATRSAASRWATRFTCSMASREIGSRFFWEEMKMKFTRRDVIKTTAGLAAGAMLPALHGGRTAFAQDLTYKPEDGASLRVLRWSPFVKGDEEQWLANTKKFTETMGVDVRV